MWRATEHSDFENSQWLLLRSIEWIQWPLFISQPAVPILLWFYQWQPVVVAVIVIAILWRAAIATWCVSVRLADFGPIFVVLKFPTCPVMAFLIWEKGDRFGAALALLLADCGSFDSTVAEYLGLYSDGIRAPKRFSS